VLHADISHIGLAAEHYATENAIASSGLDFTFLRNGWYWENFTANVRGIGLVPTFQTGILLGAGTRPLLAERPEMIAERLLPALRALAPSE